MTSPDPKHPSGGLAAHDLACLRGERLVFKRLSFAVPAGGALLLVGPNGSGKSTVLQALGLLRDPNEQHDRLVSIDRREPLADVVLSFAWDDAEDDLQTHLRWSHGNLSNQTVRATGPADKQQARACELAASRVRVFSFDPSAISQPVSLQPVMELHRSGAGLSGVLDGLRDAWPERFETLNSELTRWLPEFDRIVFSVPSQGTRRFGLRRKRDGLMLDAHDLSGGTLFAITLLTLAHLPDPPSIIGLEEPDHGMHPRLLRRVQDAIHRLAFPEDRGEKRAATQVIATTHSPYFLDLFKDHLQDVIVANKDDQGVTFQRLTDRPHMDEILPEGSLGDLWYSGLLGGVPAEAAQL